MLYKQIVLEWGRDTETGVWGKGYSPDNGEHFYVTDTTFGRKYRQNDVDGLWNNGMHEKVKEKVNQEIANTVEPAIKQANSAVAYANEAIEKSRVNQQAIVEINSAVSDAVSDAAVARSDGLRAWNAAQSNVGLIDSNYASASAAISSARTEAIAAADEAKAAASAAQADFDTKFAGMAGNINALQVDASGMKQTLVSAKGDISTLQATATGFKNTLADAQGNISTLQSDVVGLKKTTSDHAGNIATLQADAKTLTSQMSSAQGDISTLKQTASGFSSKVSGMETSLANANSKINDVDKRIDNISTSTNIYSNSPSNWYNGTLSENQPTGVGWKSTFLTGYTNRIRPGNNGYDVTPATGTITISWADSWKIFLLEYDSNKNYIGKQANSVWHTTSPYTVKLTNNTRYIAIALAKTDDSNISPNDLIDSNKNPIVKLKVEQGSTATPFSRCAQDTDAKITTNSAAIDQNKKAIALKADQTAVDKINGTVSQLQSSLSVQAGQIQEKVTSSQVTGMLTGYATQEYAQGLVTLKADEWNVNLTKLKTDVNAIKTTGGGVNLVKNTSTDITIDATSSNANNWTFATIHFTEQPKQGDLITVSAEGTLTGTGTLDEYQVVLYDEHTSYSRSTAQYLKAGKRDSVTLTLDNLGGYGDTILLIYAGKAGETQGKKNVVHHLMVEEGIVAHPWSPAPSDMATVTSVTNLSATVDGIKSTVATKADQSEVTQLSNLVQTKVSSGDFTSTTTQLKNLINQRVQVGDVISQINQEAGGDTLIQVSNGKKSLILDAGNTIVTGKAWIPVACIADLTADKIKAGTLTGSTVHLDDGNGNTIDLGGLATSYVGFHSKATNGDQTYIDLNGIHNYGASYDTKISQGKITTNYMTVNGGGLIDFRSSGNGTTIDSQNIKFYNSNAVNGGIEFSGGNPIATVRNGTVGNELRVRYDRSFALTPITDESARICASSAAMQVGFVQSGRSTPDRQTTGLWVDGDKRHVNLGVWGADSTWARVEANTHNIHMQADKAHAWLSSDNVFHIYKDGDSSSTATKLQVDGWAWVNGWVEAAGHSQHSALSTKTDIQSVDDDKMLEMVNNTDLTSFLYTSDVANGETHRHIGLIIDDVHDVAQYQTPQEFIAPNGVSRDDDNMIGALFGAVKALTKRIKTLESKVG